MNDEFLTVDEAAALLKLHRRTLYKWLKTGVVPSFRLGPHGAWRLEKKALLNFLKKKGEG